MIQVDKSLILQIINFLFLLWILNLILYRPIRRILAERKEHVRRCLEEIRRLSSEIDRQKAEIVELTQQARREGFEKKEILKKAAKEEEARILADISAGAEEEIRKVKEQISRDILAARESLQAQMATFARELASKILGRQVA